MGMFTFSCTKERDRDECVRLHFVRYFVYDPSAGSPTETLLRLLLPLSAPVRASFRRTHLNTPSLEVIQGSPVQGSHWYTQSVVATGGVYKGQGLSHSELSDPPLLGIPRLWERIASPRPKHAKEEERKHEASEPL